MNVDREQVTRHRLYRVTVCGGLPKSEGSRIAGGLGSRGSVQRPGGASVGQVRAWPVAYAWGQCDRVMSRSVTHLSYSDTVVYGAYRGNAEG